MSKHVNADTKQHEITVWGMSHQMSKAEQRWLSSLEDEEGHSINDMIRIVRKLKKLGHSATKIDITIDMDGLIHTQWNDGIGMVASYNGIDTMLNDLLLLRKWFNAPRPE